MTAGEAANEQRISLHLVWILFLSLQKLKKKYLIIQSGEGDFGDTTEEPLGLTLSRKSQMGLLSIYLF